MSCRRPVAAGLAACLLLACAGPPGERGAKVSAEERAAYAATVRATDAETAAALEAFLTRYPASVLADDAALRLAALARKQGDAARAAAHYAWIARNHGGGDRVDAARLGLAELEQERGDAAAAAVRLRSVRLERLVAPERARAFRLHADLATDTGERLEWLARLRGVEGDAEAVQRVDAEIDRELLMLDRAALVEVARELAPDPPAGRLLVQAAELALAAGDIEGARRELARAEKVGVAERYEPRLAAARHHLRVAEHGPLDAFDLPSLAEALERFAPSTRGAEGTLGVVLPLSGRFARFGEESLQGVLLAAGVWDEAGDPEAPRVRVIVRDSAGRADAAARAVYELADAGVVAIVGPLLRDECEAAARAAERAEVPLLALTAREDVSRGRDYVFRLRTRAAEEVNALVNHAVGELGARRFAILYPKDAYGRGLRALFWEAVEHRGGTIVGVAGYDPGATDFAKPIRRLVGYELLGPEEKAALAEREDLLRRARRLPPERAAELRTEAAEITGPDEAPLPPLVDFDALFIPGSHDKVVLIAPQLAFHEATGAVLLGANGWHHDDLVRIARNHVEGAYYTVHFHGESEVAPVREFTRHFQDEYARPPDVLAAQAFDATNLVLIQLARGRHDRDALRDGVLDVTTYPGVTGTLTMTADGSARKRPFLLRVERRGVVGVD